jgi:GT2 family glycosyltransferase
MLVRVSVIIPNWNGAHHLPTCLTALRRQTFRDFEVIVADNGSIDGSLAQLARDYPEVRVVSLPNNRGFAGACNAGINAARGELLVLLNNDTEAEPDWLAELVRTLDAHPEAGMAAAKLRLFDRRNVLHSAGDVYCCDGTPANRGVWLEDEGQFDQAIWVFSPCGGAAAYRRSMLAEIGLFDEGFGNYLEDVDLGWRAQLAGYRCVFAPRAVVYHRLSATGGGKIASFYTGRNTLWVIAKNYPGSLLRRHWRAIVTAQLRIAADALQAWRGEAARARLRGQLAGLLTWPWLLPRRRRVQRARRASDAYLESLLEGC